MKINIAIDGPSAAGKSTVAKKLASQFGYVHLDTGAMYRCTAYKALKLKLDLEDEESIISMLKDTEIVLKSDGSIYLDGMDVGDLIRENEISMAASLVSKAKKVRAYLVSMQQKMAVDKGVIMDGRDIGTVVLKDAEVKIFLVASSHARGLRRHQENQEKGITSDLSLITEEIEVRDLQDQTREHSPLKKAKDAHEIDTSSMNIDEVTQVISVYVNEAIKEHNYD